MARSVLVFDLDQTLFDRRQAFTDWIRTFGLKPETQADLQRIDQNGYGDRSYFFETFRVQTGLRLDQATLTAGLLQHIHRDHVLLDCLSKLRSRYTLAVLTNGGIETQHAKWQALGLENVIAADHFFVSEQIGFAKPDRRAFEFVADRLGTDVARCTYFGDQPTIDVDGAIDAGWNACLVTGPGELQTQLEVRLQATGEPIQC
ncbi:HAD family hydrolase [Rhodopirellula sp. MGV]|uniref:HAD family hydrolase n=1 Tax=Rhodopirellula sp. MGV TaxID=2023130 RepID=UPI000B97BF2B|nr:HAD family hydrolase [Rhodopirellula sp. MGV]OYP36422.1 hypothetical protein CGZ80_08960 [Rhodopirellula sp. MGV]PNY36848.1 HAD family hydrolase [Rhodopirellula baltica]